MSLVTPTRILIVGSGGREHALAWKLAGEPGVNEVIVAPGSDGIAAEPRVRCAHGVDPLEPAEVVAIARAESVELAIIGPEAPLAVGVADALIAAGVPTFGPTAAAARIEASKAFCHDIATAAGVRMARSAPFATLEPAVTLARSWARDGHGVVVKADGLAAGKGVTVCDDAAQAEDALRSLFAHPVRPHWGPGDAPVALVEERLEGPEASVIALCDGRDALGLPAARDHKRLADGDRGPNTGGMGAYSPLPDLSDSVVEALVERIHRPILAELDRRGSPFRGALYAGLMLTADGPVLLECNARFGDPETQVILPRLGVALGPLLLAAARGELLRATRPLGLDAPLVPVTPGAAVGIVLAAAGYPGTPRGGDRISGLDDAVRRGGLVFHAGTRAGPDGGFTTAGGRVVTVVGRGPDLSAARSAATHAADAIAFAGAVRRGDIATDPPRPAELPVGTGGGR